MQSDFFKWYCGYKLFIDITWKSGSTFGKIKENFFGSLNFLFIPLILKGKYTYKPSTEKF